MHNSCCITLCSKKREQAIIRDATAREVAEEIPTSTSQSSIHSDSLPTYPLKKTQLSTGLIHKKRSMRRVHEKEGQETP